MNTEALELLRDWSGPYGGVPPFDRVQVSAFEAALEAAMEENLAEVDRIADRAAAPDFENTIAAMERAGRALDRVITLYGVWSSAMSTPAFQAVERLMAPRLAAFSDRITQNEKLFARIEHVYETRAAAGLAPEQQRLAWLYHTEFVRAGARLAGVAKAPLSAINQRLAVLFTHFSQNLLADEGEPCLVLEHDAQLAGLPDSVCAAAAAAAAAEGLDGCWLVRNTRSAVEPFLTFSTRRDLRERAWRAWTRRGDNGDAHDNNAIVVEILTLRTERAALLGYETHAHWRLENTMAGTPANALELMQAVWTPATQRVREEVAAMQGIAHAEGADHGIEPWDYRHYAEKVRRAHYDLDQTKIKPYLQLENLRNAMFWVAERLFGLSFRRITDVPVYHPDVEVWAVTEGDRHAGLWYFDPYARAGKRSGAWMSSYRTQELFDRPVTAVVSNNANFVRGRPGDPVLMAWDDALTLFHEFGHALHGLVSAVSYPSLAGTAVPRDYVEFPSQLLEHWLSTREVLERFALHCETGEPIPAALVERIERAATFNEGFATTEYLASAMVDMRLHLASPAVDPAHFEQRTLRELGMPPEIAMRHRIPHFAHIFASDAYSAAYYSYLWADVLTADAFAAFTEAGGPYDAQVAARLREHVFARGNTLDPAEAYRRFRGRDADTAALLRKRGFGVPV
ncbi:MAG TPA: M3 family metallopeptidase [Longimicrobiales bacterium]